MASTSALTKKAPLKKRMPKSSPAQSRKKTASQPQAPGWVAMWETASAMQAAQLTIGLRTMDIMQDGSQGRLCSNRELPRMVGEKMDAASEGWTNFAFTWARASATPMKTTHDIWADLFLAYMRPGYSKAEANARRLIRRPSQKK